MPIIARADDGIWSPQDREDMRLYLQSLRERPKRPKPESTISGADLVILLLLLVTIMANSVTIMANMEVLR